MPRSPWIGVIFNMKEGERDKKRQCSQLIPFLIYTAVYEKKVK